MYYGNIKFNDIANGEGVRTSLFVSGCTNCCRGCFQPETWAFDYGQRYTAKTKETLLESLSEPHIQGLTVLGGEPFEYENQEEVADLLEAAKRQYPDKDIWVYTGFTLEEIQNGKRSGVHADRMLRCIDVLVDGKYVDQLSDITLRFRGSSNQRIINIPETLRTGKPVLYKDF